MRTLDIFSETLFLGCGSDVESKFIKKSKYKIIVREAIERMLLDIYTEWK